MDPWDELAAYRKLEVWRVAVDLVEAVYRVSTRMPRSEQFGLTNQIRRAATSIPANIAEGYGRLHRGDYTRHLSIARGSLMELEAHLIVSVRLGFLPRDAVVPVWDTAPSVGRMLTSLIASLQEA